MALYLFASLLPHPLDHIINCVKSNNLTSFSIGQVYAKVVNGTKSKWLRGKNTVDFFFTFMSIKVQVESILDIVIILIQGPRLAEQTLSEA